MVNLIVNWKTWGRECVKPLIIASKWMNECFYKTIKWWPDAKSTDTAIPLPPSTTAIEANKIKLHLQLCALILPREFSAAVDSISKMCACNTTLQTHKKGEFLHKINIHFILMYFMLPFFRFLQFFLLFLAGAVQCNIIRRRKMNYYLIYCNFQGASDRVRVVQ